MGCWEAPSVALPGMGVTSRGRDGPEAESAEGEGRREGVSAAERYSSNKAGLEAVRGKLMFLDKSVFWRPATVQSDKDMGGGLTDLCGWDMAERVLGYDTVAE